MYPENFTETGKVEDVQFLAEQIWSVKTLTGIALYDKGDFPDLWTR